MTQRFFQPNSFEVMQIADVVCLLFWLSIIYYSCNNNNELCSDNRLCGQNGASDLNKKPQGKCSQCRGDQKLSG